MHDYAAQFAKQQADQRAARMRAAEAAEAAANGTAPPEKAKGGFTGRVKADDPDLHSDGTPKKLNYDESVTQSWESSDVPDFLPEEGSEYEKYAKIRFDDGIRGSQHDGEEVAELEKLHNPEMQISADPQLIFMPEGEECDAECLLEEFGARDFVLPEASWNANTMSETQFDAELNMFTIRGEGAPLAIEVQPVAMAFEDFYCGFTVDSHPAFKVTENSFGKMERRKGAPTTVEVTCDPQGEKGMLVGYLCFILPEEKDFSTFYKITCDAH